MARKINKKSRRFISRRRRGAINKRTLRRNKSRVGGDLVLPSSLFSNPQFKFTFKEKTYVIEKKRGFKMRDTTYNIFIDGEAQDEANKNIKCESIISKLIQLNNDNKEWLVSALETLIDDYNSTTNNHSKPENFEHFNELLLRMIEYFTENYITFQQSHPDKWYEFGQKIKKIIDSEWCEKKENILKLCGSKSVNLNNDTLTQMYRDAAFAKNAAFKKADAEKKAKYEAAIIEVLKANPAEYAKTIICILKNIDSYKTICDQVYVNQLRQLLVSNSMNFNDILIDTHMIAKFANICAYILNSQKSEITLYNELLESIVIYTFNKEKLVPGSFLRTNTLASKTCNEYFKLNPDIVSVLIGINNLDEITLEEINAYTEDVNTIIKEGQYRLQLEEVRDKTSVESKKTIEKIIILITNILNKLTTEQNVIPDILSDIVEKFNTLIDNSTLINKSDKHDFKQSVQKDAYLRYITPILFPPPPIEIDKKLTFLTSVFQDKINNIKISTAVNEKTVVNIISTQVLPPLIVKRIE
jgi:hypothetical protein